MQVFAGSLSSDQILAVENEADWLVGSFFDWWNRLLIVMARTPVPVASTSSYTGGKYP